MARDPALTARIMAAVRSRDTEPEVLLQKALRVLRRRFRVYPSKVPGHPDIVFPRERVAVFMDGDFWHGRQWRLRGLPSLDRQFSRAANRSYWIWKITRNVKRDRRTNRQLRRLGWHVVRVWESDLRANPERCVRRVQRVLERAS